MTASGASFTDAHAGDAQETLARRITELEQNSAQELFAGVWRLLEDREAEVEAYRRLRALARAGSLNSGFIRNELQVPSRLDPVACKVLGVPRDARLSEVRAAYRTLAAQFHPDATRELHDDERARSAEAFLKIQNAYEKLRTQLAHTGTE
jgi:DnaJ-domain-containing protein 1